MLELILAIWNKSVLGRWQSGLSAPLIKIGNQMVAISDLAKNTSL